MQLGLSTEFIGDQLIHLPRLGKQVVVLLIFLHCTLEPSESTFSVLE
jgi:hypothetical protein